MYFGTSKILQMRIYYFVIHSLLFGMKFCKTSHIQAQEQPHINDENHPPNLPIPDATKPTLEPISQQELYRPEIERFMLANSTGFRVGNYFAIQPDLSEHMRGVLLNWLVEVHQKYKLAGETYFLMVRLIDLYLSVETIPRNRLQLLGITALWVAAKYHQTYQVPKIQNLVYICDNAYKPQDILAMEGRLILATGFSVLTSTSPLSYYEIVQRHAQLAEKDYWLGRYLLEASTLDLQLQRFSPATLAYSLSFFIKKLRGYSCEGEEELRRMCGAGESEVRVIARQLCELWQRGAHLQCLASLRLKYGQRQFFQVSKIRLSERTR